MDRVADLKGETYRGKVIHVDDKDEIADLSGRRIHKDHPHHWESRVKHDAKQAAEDFRRTEGLPKNDRSPLAGRTEQQEANAQRVKQHVKDNHERRMQLAKQAVKGPNYDIVRREGQPPPPMR